MRDAASYEVGHFGFLSLKIAPSVTVDCVLSMAGVNAYVAQFDWLHERMMRRDRSADSRVVSLMRLSR